MADRTVAANARQFPDTIVGLRPSLGRPGTHGFTTMLNMSYTGYITNSGTYAAQYAGLLVALNTDNNQYEAAHVANNITGNNAGLIAYDSAGNNYLPDSLTRVRNVFFKGVCNVLCCSGDADPSKAVAVRTSNLDTTLGSEDVYGQIEVHTGAQGQTLLTDVQFFNTMDAATGIVMISMDCIKKF